MDFSFSFMQGIMGNTIQQPPQLIDSANIRQDDVFDSSSDIVEDGGQTPYEVALQQDFAYPEPTTEELPPISNGYAPNINLYEPQTKYPIYSQFPNGSANGFGAVRNFNTSEYYQMENNNLRLPEALDKPSLPQLPPPPPDLVPQLVTPKKTGSPEIKLKITKTIQNGRELFESSLCGDLLNEVQAGKYYKTKHAGKKEKRKKSSKHDSSRLEERKSHKVPKLDPEEPKVKIKVEPEEATVNVEPELPTVKLEPEIAKVKLEPETSKVKVASERSKVKVEPAKPKMKEHLPAVVKMNVEVIYQVGDLVWSKVGTYPWWPCMVSLDPQLQVHTKTNARGGREYHVQFFGSIPERAWVYEKRVQEYKGHSQYDQLLAEAARKATNHAEKQKILKPIPQRERAQWEVGIAHAEEALKMTKEARIEQYTFIYVDEEPGAPASTEKHNCAKTEAKKGRKHRTAMSPVSEQPTVEEEPQMSPSTEGRRQRLRRQSVVVEPPIKMVWKTAAARKSLPASLIMQMGNQEGQNHETPLTENKNLVLSIQGSGADGRLTEKFNATKGATNKTETDKGQDKHIVTPASQKNERASLQHTISETASGSLEKKQQRRSVRSRSESERSADAVPKKKVKKEQVEILPQAAVKTGSQKGASEISDSCKPLKKRSRASTDVEVTSLTYRDTSDSDSRGLNEVQVGFGKSADSPSAVADAEASDSQSVDSSLSRRGTGTTKKDTVCQICASFGESLVTCEGECYRLFHMECLGLTALPEGKFICIECKAGSHTCFSCKVPGTDVKRCSVNACGRFFHESCARKYSTSMFESKGFRCPQHCCTTCSIDKDIHKASKGRMMRCLQCPVAYHTGDSCVVAGSVVLTPHIIICSDHSKRSSHSVPAVNVGFCFVCSRGLLVQDLSDPLLSAYANKSHYLLSESYRAELMKLPMIPSSSSASKKKVEKGGRLLCCESCPASFHPECLNIEMPEGSWYCNECKAGKKLHYKQIVWVKLGNYRWWPAEICSPRSVPHNIQGIKHDIGDFPVFFFGSHDYYWVHRGRVFPYVEGDKSFAEGQISGSKTFKKALDEAAKRFQELKAQRESKEALENERNSRKPIPYKHIRTNKPVGKVQIHIADLSEIPRCNCKPDDENPCGLDSECLNKMLQYECHPQVCPAAEHCQNQSFSKRLYPETEVIKTEGRGWGLQTKCNIRKGEFVNEYVGELIDEQECRSRIKKAHENNVTNFYMLTLTKDRIIDAGPKGNYSRFMNHSCNPNCETQKWTVNGDVRVGLFALCDISAGTELTFNYNLDCLGNGRTKCYCAAENCSGFLGVRPKTACATATEEKAKIAKLKQKKRKIKLERSQMHEDYCFHCGDGGELVMCDKKDCPKAYHLLCLNLTKPPVGRWECPWHQCSECNSPAVSHCEFCPSSFCKDHEKGSLVSSALEGRLCCSKHDPKCPVAPESWAWMKCKTEPQDTGEEPTE
ncbi:histone-lysine N-methyltransferase NSD3 isoform X3 [Latimeria chalumnae]|uniref:histone-lysine N-methyltransferase NSD3 isoform X3 n=1 Tax=Latimeria chalumnae TaxID=7897 RepID=UPI0003C196DD|nr:PREDICTED: histone-lysine N-methyltransferase NSD3 isoform X3 [Latimeria chalumnae]|eukprot:XP_006000427.1 PREDICTED: histone-lysine N-methyltransferase NSD3 isoform X3 [Latimeria chalumnae]